MSSTLGELDKKEKLIKFEDLPEQVRQLLTDQYTQTPLLNNFALELNAWITILQINNQYTEEIALALFPIVYGDVDEHDRNI
jgi:hypothetical protein